MLEHQQVSALIKTVRREAQRRTRKTVTKDVSTSPQDRDVYTVDATA